VRHLQFVCLRQIHARLEGVFRALIDIKGTRAGRSKGCRYPESRLPRARGVLKVVPAGSEDSISILPRCARTIHSFLDSSDDRRLGHFTIEQVDRSIRLMRIACVVSHHADCGAALMQVAQQSHHRFTVLRIEISGRLIGE
jgi:hypothetical protein